jgi:hypothetical protein
VLAAPAMAQGVKVGVLNDQSGVYADYGGKWSYKAALIAVEDFGGSVLGQKIELVTAGHQNKPDLATSIARRWHHAEGVDMIAELTTSSVPLAAQELSKEKKKSTSWWERRPRRQRLLALWLPGTPSGFSARKSTWHQRTSTCVTPSSTVFSTPAIRAHRRGLGTST